MVVVVAA